LIGSAFVTDDGLEDAAMFVPPDPRRLLMLAPGHPWPDGSRTDEDLRTYARWTVRRWQPFGVQHAAILLSPVFGSRHPDFREGGSASARATALAREVVARHLPESDGRFAIHGHSAGAQFAVRYLVTHADRLTDAVISAPSEYAFPDPDVAWPHGAASAPHSADWVAATRRVRVTVLVGTRDVDGRPTAPGHADASRFERARAWVTAMRRCAEDDQRPATVQLRLVEGVDHDETNMTAAAQTALAERWR
jgi:hypothetical protein